MERNFQSEIQAVLLALGPLTGLLYSYSKIVSSIRKISSAQGKYKAFSTCASHLSVLASAAHPPILKPESPSIATVRSRRVRRRGVPSHPEPHQLSLQPDTRAQPRAPAIALDSHLHTPMYFFLTNLSFSDICLTSTTVPQMLVNIQTQSWVITFEGCIMQLHFFIVFASLENFFLAMMAYDCFVAICCPLHYTGIMNPPRCVFMVVVSWILRLLHALLQSLMVLRLSFCIDLEIPHFFCELYQVVQLACSDTFPNDLVMYVTSVLLGGGPLAGILYSYSKIVSSIRAISSAQGRYNTFSTCASHLSVVSLLYFAILGVYFSAAATHNSHSGTTASVMYSVVTPMLNPFIYNPRNKDIKSTLRRYL
ncbi:olfactory receptor 1571-like [Sciurus carolinensis]|uniref:olfactory receptor 1571-like n=1 Tax=Sciurus carolinensis TaxID=30640 RepID=UPI001FB46EC9|nr:olfactory receptor 1571-like [Sciurus carolinensis]